MHTYRPWLLLFVNVCLVSLGTPSTNALTNAPNQAAARLEGTLPRRADLGFEARAGEGRLEIARLATDGAAERAGLRIGDQIVAVQGAAATSPDSAREALRRLAGGRDVTLRVVRSGAELSVRFRPPALPLEVIEGLETIYGTVPLANGVRLRVVKSRPRGTTAPLPALFLTQWVSCGGIEPLSDDSWGQVIRSVAQRSGAVLLRVDRSSGGDSEGPACHELDHDTEVSQYRQALDVLAADPWVDPERVVILGLSLGSTTAPLVAQGRALAGVIAVGGGGLTYFERLLAFDRLAFERAAEPITDIDARMNRHAEFLVEYLLRQRSPAEIAAQWPHLAGTWSEMRGTGVETHYGRPFEWHRQAARRDLLAAWDNVDAPVLVVYGEFDQFEPPHAFRAITDRIERRRPGTARLVEVPAMSHFFEVHPTAEDAMSGHHTVGAPELAAVPILRFLRDSAGFAAQP